MITEVEPKEEDEDEDEDFLNGKVITAEPDPEEGADIKPTNSSEGTAVNWEKLKKIKNVSTGPVIQKPKMDMAKALTVMGFSSTRNLDPSTNDTRGVLAGAVDKKELYIFLSRLIFSPASRAWLKFPISQITVIHAVFSIRDVGEFQRVSLLKMY